MSFFSSMLRGVQSAGRAIQNTASRVGGSLSTSLRTLLRSGRFTIQNNENRPSRSSFSQPKVTQRESTDYWHAQDECESSIRHSVAARLKQRDTQQPAFKSSIEALDRAEAQVDAAVRSSRASLGSKVRGSVTEQYGDNWKLTKAAERRASNSSGADHSEELASIAADIKEADKKAQDDDFNARQQRATQIRNAISPSTGRSDKLK